VSERVFPSGVWASDDDRATTLVCELLEQLLEEISRPSHYWPGVNQQTGMLREITAVMATTYPVQNGPKQDR
jgi:hypothetical protein